MQRQFLTHGRVLREPQVWAVVAAFALLVLPILAAQHLNIVDGPGHVARLAVLQDALLNGRASPFYEVTSFFLPNIAYDVIGLGLVRFTDPETATRIFLAVTLVLTLSGVMVLNRVVIGRWSIVPLAAAFLVTNLVVVQGFLNYAFGLALVPWALALRLKLERAPFGFVAGAGAGIVLLFCHLFAFGVYAAMACGLAIAAWRGRAIEPPRLALRLLEFVPALVLVMLMPHDPSRNLHYDPSFLVGKLTGIVKSISSGSLAGDIAFLIGMAACAAMLLFARVKFAHPLIPGLILLAVLYLVLPSELGHGSYVDKRMPIAIGMFLIAAVDARIRWAAVPMALAGLVALALAAKEGALAMLWHRVDPEINSAVTALDMLPPGAVIFRAECRPAENMLGIYRAHQPAITHLAALATLEGTRFAAGTWAIAGQQPIAVRPAYQPAYDLQTGIAWSVCGEQPLRRTAARIHALTDGHPHFLFVIRPTPPRSLEPDAVLVANGEEFELYRVN
jgi:hypothetical protein